MKRKGAGREVSKSTLTFYVSRFTSFGYLRFASIASDLSKKGMGSIVVVGSSNTDMVVRVPRMPRPGETVLGGTFFMAAGGKGANQAVAAARAGGAVTLVACVGKDAFGEQAVQGFREDGIDTEYVFRMEEAPSGVALIMVDDGGENSIAVASGANARLLRCKNWH